jgi:hypothetical protein
MIIADITMAGEVMAMDSEKKYTLGIVDSLSAGRALFLMEEKHRACVIYDSLPGGKNWVSHILSKRDFRGKELWEFAHSTAWWMVKNRRMEYMLSFVASDNKLLKVFVRYFKIEKVADIGEESLYVVGAEQILNFGV